MGHIKRVAKLKNQTRVMLCSKFYWETDVKPEIKGKIKQIAYGISDNAEESKVEKEDEVEVEIVKLPDRPVYIK